MNRHRDLAFKYALRQRNALDSEQPRDDDLCEHDLMRAYVAGYRRARSETKCNNLRIKELEKAIDALLLDVWQEDDAWAKVAAVRVRSLRRLNQRPWRRA